MRILVMDDEQSIRRVLDRAPRKDGHEVVTPENVEDASVKLTSERIDVLLLRIRG
jgi:DNA-binding response OmpR family regulator